MHKKWQDQNRFLELLENPWYKLLVKLQNFISVSTYKYWDSQQLQTLHLPITTSTVSSPMGLGSDSKPVKIKLGGVETYLADSMQFMLEYGCRFFDEGSFYIMPSFRGEDCSPRHLSQFYHSEIEVPGNLEKVIQMAEGYIKFLSQGILQSFGIDIAQYTGDVSHLEVLANSTKNLPRITFDDALKQLNNDPLYIHHSSDGWRTLTHNGESELIRQFSGFVWVTHFDHLSMPFYQAFADDRMKTALCADLLFGIGEVIGSGERHQTADDTLKALALHRVPVDDYHWYVHMKRKIPKKTSGFGMGIERFLLWVLRHADIRDMQILPRFIGVKINP